MSQANSLARKRRAGITQNPFPPSNSSNPSVSNQSQNQGQNPGPNVKQVGLTLPQVVAVIDSRLILLETFMKESKSKDTFSSNSSSELMKMPSLTETDEDTTNEFISEVNHRFEFLMNEIADLKDIVMKLQSYTMEVNKSLLEERIHLLSDIGSSPIPQTLPTITIGTEPVKIEESISSDSV